MGMYIWRRVVNVSVRICEWPKSGMNPCPGYSEKFAICAGVCVSVCVPFCICVSVSVVSVSVHASVSVGSVLDEKTIANLR